MGLFNRNPLDWDNLSSSLKTLILVNIAVYLVQWILPYPGSDRMIELFGLTPHDVTRHFWVWQLVTYMFLHGGLLHLFFNMFMLWMFGNVLEAQWGSAEFLKFFFICGIGAGLTSVALGWNSLTPTIGASGAIFGLLVAFGMVYPDAVVYVWFFIPMTARSMAVVFGAIEFMLTLSHARTNVAGIAHLGGMATGYLYLKYGWRLSSRLRMLGRALSSPFTGFNMPKAPVLRGRRRDPADDLENEVNRILDKVLTHGAGSLTPEEREVMRRYSQRKELH